MPADLGGGLCLDGPLSSATSTSTGRYQGFFFWRQIDICDSHVVFLALQKLQKHALQQFFHLLKDLCNSETQHTHTTQKHAAKHNTLCACVYQEHLSVAATVESCHRRNSSVAAATVASSPYIYRGSCYIHIIAV